MACKAYRDLAYERGIKYPEMYVGVFFVTNCLCSQSCVFFGLILHSTFFIKSYCLFYKCVQLGETLHIFDFNIFYFF